ncbi:hypothetical protein VQ02_06815 [Methylobacterium variabile]|uniref:histidine kinase n=1 Tax=Methylobacterium variabile TaxID=298794 RepID=A0A0J6T4Z0_9HYPH|nr:DAHL domain-containing protein [Methylobacterium variabile]KMO40882.1 hypothetical protein VQ02_06815 [Methylobacterium variabile]
MKSYGIATIVLGSALLFAAYTLTRDLMPDSGAHQRTLAVFLRSFLADARLRREVLQAQVGVAVNYDVLNDQIATLRDGAAELRAVAPMAFGSHAGAIVGALEQFAENIAAKEDLVEQFKSTSALVQNSNQIFSYVVGELSGESASKDAPLANGVLHSAIALTTFAHRPDRETEAKARSALDALASLPVDRQDGDRLKTLLRHGTLLIDLIPRIDDLTARIERTDLYDAIWLLRSSYLDAYAERERMAGHVQLLLFGSALLLALYNIRLLYQLARSATRLEQRLSLEQTAATISRHLLSLPWKRTAQGIGYGLERLARQIGGDTAQMLIVDAGGRVEAAYCWPATVEPLTAGDIGHLLDRGSAPAGQDESFSVVPGADHPNALLRFPLQGPGDLTGYLVITRKAGRARIELDDRILLNLVGDIFRSALERLHQEEERQKLQVQLARAQRLEALGTLASSVVHEFSNILGAIRGHAELAGDKLAEDGPPRDHIAQILVGSARAQAVIDKVLTFGRRRSDHRHPFDASDALAEALTLLSASVPDTIAFRREIDAGIMLDGDVTEFQQIVLNLCTNAVHAMGGKGEIGISLATVDLDGGEARPGARLSPGRYARLRVEDTGSGIPPGVMDRIFEPFFTTKGAGAGTGLGLSTVHDIVAAWTGGIDVSSTPGRGTRMQVYLPVAAEHERGTLGSGLVRGSGEAVLLVERDPDRLRRDEEMIAALGYEPVGFSDGSRALAAFRSRPERFGIAIVEADAGTGLDLPRALAAIRADFRVLVMAETEAIHHVVEAQTCDVRDIISAPLSVNQIAGLIASRLSRHPARSRPE